MEASQSASVAVLVLTYNHGKYIANCLKSILSCDFGRFHIWVLDDGSTDNTAAEINRVASEHGKISLICQPQSGGKTAANSQRLVDESQGKYILLMSGDDMLGPSFPLAQTIECLETNQELSLVIPRMVYLTQDPSQNIQSIYTRELKDALQSGDPMRVLQAHLYKRVSRIFLQGTVIRRDVVNAMGGFDTELIADDYAFIVRLFQYLVQKNNRFSFNSECLWLYRVHESNIHSHQLRQFLLVLQVVTKYVPPEYWDDFRWDINAFDSFDQLAQAKAEIEKGIGAKTGRKLLYRLERAMLRSARKRGDSSLLTRAMFDEEVGLCLKGYAVTSLLKLFLSSLRLSR